jgi:hypothetical protein
VNVRLYFCTAKTFTPSNLQVVRLGDAALASASEADRHKWLSDLSHEKFANQALKMAEKASQDTLAASASASARGGGGGASDGVIGFGGATPPLLLPYSAEAVVSDLFRRFDPLKKQLLLQDQDTQPQPHLQPQLQPQLNLPQIFADLDSYRAESGMTSTSNTTAAVALSSLSSSSNTTITTPITTSTTTANCSSSVVDLLSMFGVAGILVKVQRSSAATVDPWIIIVDHVSSCGSCGGGSGRSSSGGGSSGNGSSSSGSSDGNALVVSTSTAIAALDASVAIGAVVQEMGIAMEAAREEIPAVPAVSVAAAATTGDATNSTSQQTAVEASDTAKEDEAEKATAEAFFLDTEGHEDVCVVARIALEKNTNGDGVDGDYMNDGIIEDGSIDDVAVAPSSSLDTDTNTNTTVTDTILCNADAAVGLTFLRSKLHDVYLSTVFTRSPWVIERRL